MFTFDLHSSELRSLNYDTWNKLVSENCSFNLADSLSGTHCDKW